jgi:hypothetical protein
MMIFGKPSLHRKTSAAGLKLMIGRTKCCAYLKNRWRRTFATLIADLSGIGAASAHFEK